MSSSGLATQVCDTPLLRADVPRLEILDDPPPLEDGGPLRVDDHTAEDALHMEEYAMTNDDDGSSRLLSRPLLRIRSESIRNG